MQRVHEPELMDDDEQARAYADADFSAPHGRFITLFEDIFGSSPVKGNVLDLGCGPGDISFRFARANPDCIVHGLDGAEAMLRCGRQLLDDAHDLRGRVLLVDGLLPGADLPLKKYDVIISNSLLHHLSDPSVFWSSVMLYGAQGAQVFVQDLMRPDTPDEAMSLVDMYMRDEPEILRRDFYNSLFAAFDLHEIRQQLQAAGMDDFDLRPVSDRHLVVSGRLS